MTIPKLSLEGKIAIVTGARKGIGKGIALAFADAGADLALCSRTTQDGELENLAEQIRKMGRRAFAMKADTSIKSDVLNFVQATVEKLGTVDILVNNAGVALRGPILDFAESDWDNLLDIDLKGYFLCAQAAGKIMVQKKSGKIINVASQHAFKATQNFGVYCIAKTGVVMLTKVLARELGPSNVWCNCIAPGLVKTDFSKASWSKPGFLAEREATLPLGRVAEVDDMIGTALFLASDVSTYVTGQTLLLDGGGNL